MCASNDGMFVVSFIIVESKEVEFDVRIPRPYTQKQVLQRISDTVGLP